MSDNRRHCGQYASKLQLWNCFPEGSIPLITFLLGCIALLGWLLAASGDKTSIDILRRSIWPVLILPLIIGVPLLLLAIFAGPALAGLLGSSGIYVLGLVLTVVVEEAIKLRAASLEDRGIRTFAIVSLFGIFELAFFKPIMVIGVSATTTLEAILIQASMLPALLMHVLTAVIYGFYLNGKPAAQFAICAGIHLAFNLTADRVESDWLWLSIIVPLALLTWLLIPNRQSAKRGNWCH